MRQPPCEGSTVRPVSGDQWKAAFITNQGLFEPNVMFFGLTNSPATFQMMMNAIFQEELREGWLTDTGRIVRAPRGRRIRKSGAKPVVEMQ